MQSKKQYVQLPNMSLFRRSGPEVHVVLGIRSSSAGFIHLSSLISDQNSKMQKLRTVAFDPERSHYEALM